MDLVKLNKASENISVSLPGWLVELIDEVCDQYDFNRSTFIKRAVKRYILTKLDNPTFWRTVYEHLREKS